MPEYTQKIRSERRRVPSLEVPRVNDPGLQAYLEAIAEQLRLYEGNNPAGGKQRFVTLDELSEAGLALVDTKNTYSFIKGISRDADVTDETNALTSDPRATATTTGVPVAAEEGTGDAQAIEALGDIGDVNVEEVAADSFLKYNSSTTNWEAVDLLDGSLTFTGFTVDGDANVTGTLTVGSFSVSSLSVNSITIGSTETLVISEDDTDFNFTFTGATSANLIGLTSIVLDQGTSVGWVDGNSGENEFLSVTAGGEGEPGGDPYWANVIFYSNFDGADGDTETTERSRYSWPISFGGTAQLDDAQKKFGDTSLLLDGNSDYVGIPSEDELQLQDFDFSMEAWVRLSSATARATILSKYASNISQASWIWTINETGTNEMTFFGTSTLAASVGTTSRVTGAYTWAANTWYHCAAYRRGNTVYLFVDGTDIGNAGFSRNLAQNSADVEIGSVTLGGGRGAYLGGWIDDVRITKGVARNIAGFTAPVEPYSARNGDVGFGLYNSVISQLNFRGEDGQTYVTDESIFNWDWTFNATAQIDTAQAKFEGAALLLDGNSDYLSLATSPAFDCAGGEPYTVEAWFRRAADATGEEYLFTNGARSGSATNVSIRITASQEIRFTLGECGSPGVNAADSTGSAISNNVWYHLACVYDGTDTVVYIDGAVDSTDTTVSGTIANTQGGDVRLGSAFGIGFWNGWVDSFRITRGEVYTGTFSVPDGSFSPHDSGANVKLRLLFNGVDGDTTYTSEDDGARTVTFSGTAALDNAQRVHGSTSLLLDGNSDYVSIPDSADFDLGASDFAFEAWVRWASDPGTGSSSILTQWDSDGVDQRGWAFYHDNNTLVFGYSTDGTSGTEAFPASSAWNPAVDTWYHVAWSRIDGELYYFADGASLGSDTVSATIFASSEDLRMGVTQGDAGLESYFNGWIDSAQLLVGQSKYASLGFPVPRVELPDTYSAEAPGGLAADDEFNVGITSKPTNIRGENVTFTNMQNRTATTAELEDVADAINTTGKVAGTQVYNTTTGIVVWASGSGAGDTWNEADGTTEHTPA